MKRIMTIVHIDASATTILTNLAKVAIHRGIEYMYATQTELYDGEDVMVFFVEKCILLGYIEEIKGYTSMSDDEKDTIWNVVQRHSEEVEGDISLDFVVTKKITLFSNKDNTDENMVEKMRNVTKNFLHYFEDAGCGLYNLDLGSNDKLSFDNSQGMFFQIYPYEKDCPIWILNYHDNDCEDISWYHLDDDDKKIIYNMFMDYFKQKK